MTRFVLGLGLALVAAAPAQAALNVGAPKGVPARAATFEGFTAAVKVTNRSKAKAKATRVAFLLSPDAKRDKKDFALGAGARVPALGKGKGAVRKSRLVVPGEATSGSYRVLACIAKRCAASKPVTVAGADPLTVAFTRDEARAETHLEGVADRYEATGADGTYYQLELNAADPEGEAITQLKLTPVTGFTPAPRAVDAQHGVLIEPAGLLLANPATLRIVPPGGATQATTFAYGFNADGSEFHLEPARFGSEQVRDKGLKEVVTIDVRETGAYGAGAVKAVSGSQRSTSPPSAADFNLPPSLRHQLSQKVAASLQQDGLANLDALLCGYYTAVVKPRLKLAETRGNYQQVLPIIVEALGIERQRQLTGSSDDMSTGCTEELSASLGKVLNRLTKEAAERCKAAGGNPFDETVELLGLLRTIQLTGSTADPTFVDVFAICAPIYDLAYRSTHQTFAPEAWLSNGVATGLARVNASTGERVEVPLEVPRPDVTYFSGCSGDFDSAAGTLTARARGVYEQRFVGGFVAGRYRPDASITVDGKLKLMLSSDTLANFTFGCEGADPPQPGEFVDHGGDQPVRSVLLPGDGGDGTVAGGDDFAQPDVCNPDCNRATATFTARTTEK